MRTLQTFMSDYRKVSQGSKEERGSVVCGDMGVWRNIGRGLRTQSSRLFFPANIRFQTATRCGIEKNGYFKFIKAPFFQTELVFLGAVWQQESRVCWRLVLSRVPVLVKAPINYTTSFLLTRARTRPLHAHTLTHVQLHSHIPTYTLTHTRTHAGMVLSQTTPRTFLYCFTI